MQRVILGEPYVSEQIGIAYDDEGNRREDLTLAECKCWIRKPNGEDAYYQEAGEEPVIYDVQPSLISERDGWYYFTFVPTETGYWSWLLEGAGIVVSGRLYVAAATEIEAPTYRSYHALISKVREMVHDICPIPSISLSVVPCGGELPQGTLNVRVTALTEYGETYPCERVSTVVNESDAVIVNIARVPQARGYRVYACLTGDETLQGEVSAATTSTTFTITSVLNGSAMPTSDTATLYLSYNAYAMHVNDAVIEYSNFYPLIKEHEIEVQPSQTTYDLPADWDANFSYITEDGVYYPADDPHGEYLEYMCDYRIISSPNGSKIYFSYPIRSGKSVLIKYTVVHSVSDDEITVPGHHMEIVALLAASKACKSIAVRYAHQAGKSIGIDSIDYRTRSSEFAKMADTFKEAAHRMLGARNGIIASSRSVSFYPEPINYSEW